MATSSTWTAHLCGRTRAEDRGRCLLKLCHAKGYASCRHGLIQHCLAKNSQQLASMRVCAPLMLRCGVL